ncbi:MAG: VacJ family lipoprotein [Holosporaceae bacterium]|jgi:phospholipid-binding lipoprotein MlaA|nr:VacJ family lipoprotein [Holosporaceae bacterium]
MGKPFLYILFLLAACSATPENPDPHREFNKDMLEFNLALDKNILKPTALAYRDVVPDVARESISDFLANLKEPFYSINYIVTCDAEHAANSLFRFVINSTLGIIGLFDVGEQIGLEKTEISHQSTLKKFDVPLGDYLVLPILGSSSTRDAIAEPIAWFADPVGYFIGFPFMLAKYVLTAISDRAENANLIDSTIHNSMDIYSTTKSMYLQKYGDMSTNADDIFLDDEED